MTDVVAIELCKLPEPSKVGILSETAPVISDHHMIGRLASGPVELTLRQPEMFKRQVYGIHDLPREIAESIQQSKMSTVHSHLNELMK